MENRRPSLKYDHQRTHTSQRSRNYSPVDLVLLAEMMERVVDTFDAERRNSEELLYQTYHGNKGDLRRATLKREYFRERAKSVSMLKNSLNFVIKPELRQSMSSISKHS